MGVPVDAPIDGVSDPLSGTMPGFAVVRAENNSQAPGGVGSVETRDNAIRKGNEVRVVEIDAGRTGL